MIVIDLMDDDQPDDYSSNRKANCKEEEGIHNVVERPQGSARPTGPRTRLQVINIAGEIVDI